MSNDWNILVYFQKENRYSIINDAKNRFKKSKFAVVKEGDKWVKGAIAYRGILLILFLYV